MGWKMRENTFDAVVIGSGLGGLTAAALLAKAGRKICVLERNHSVGGAASAFKRGALTIEPALHQTANPRWPGDSKYWILKSSAFSTRSSGSRSRRSIPSRGGRSERCSIIRLDSTRLDAPSANASPEAPRASRNCSA